MAAPTTASQRITIDGQTVSDVRGTSIPRGASLVLRLADGGEIELPSSVERMVLQALRSIARQGTVTIGELPEQLTSTSAADLLGVSRPTLMKWVREGRIEASKKGSHARFAREDVLDLRKRNAVARQAAFDELRALDDENDEFLAD